MISRVEIIKNYKLNRVDSIINVFYNEIVSKEDQKLLDLAFAKKVDQKSLDSFLKEWDIEKYGERKSMMLSYLMKANPDLEFSNYEKPRLEGLLKYHRFHNLKLISHYVKIVKALNNANIFPMILKGGAMKHIRPNLPRAMGDIDILIPQESDFLKAREICRNLGYVEEIPDGNSVELHLPNSKEGIVDIHSFIPLETKYNKKFLEDLFLRARKEEVFGTQSFVPCFEDLLFLRMINMARNLNNKTSLQGILYYLFDFRYLSESPNFNWNLVLKNIVKTKTYAQAFLAMKFSNKIIPEILPESLIRTKAVNKKFSKYCDRVIFNHFYFNALRKSCKDLNLKDALKNMENLKKYLVKKPKYFFIKRIVRKSSLLTTTFLSLNPEVFAK